MEAVLQWAAVIRDPQKLWFEDVSRRIGFSDADDFAQAFELKPFRLKQIYRAAAKELLEGPNDVTTLPKELRTSFIERGLAFSSVVPLVLQTSGDGQTTKGLFKLRDGNEVEAVLMEHYGDRTTVCISSQAGCAFACAFCSTGQAGFTRNLDSTEIFDQARFFARELAARGKKITNIVFMGMGEPFHNYDAVMGAVALLNDPHGLGLGHRHITISTVGLVDKIDRFADEGVQVNLAISLHAPSDRVRNSIMPVNRKFDTAELIAACERYVEKTNRKVFFEYVMLAGVNDTDECAQELAGLMRGRLYHVNLIPYNSTPDGAFAGSEEDRIWKFAGILDAAGVPTTVRRNMGRDIAAACGQLRAETQPKAHKAVI
ncbi:MAG TPA: 23S rRNA (adenine(2503)-C(2))-methyltransferase RlmN [Candidatus Baltobacteraceae bacterium]|jgi:23S rRNA (adenine2503-C2)-methyltransferase|nr:23S rRNA (adenine(2503)-C(2))-methyltransferase RlmN [Candidatus Baltobacteraceae bacterium]